MTQCVPLLRMTTNRFSNRRHLSTMLAIVVSCLCLESTAQAAEFQYPLAAAVTDDGTIFVADRNLPGVWKITDGQAEVYFRGSKKFRTPLNAIRCLAIDHEGHLLAGDSATRDVYRFDASGKPVPLTGGHIGIPMSIAVKSDGTLFVADLESHRIWRVAAGGGEPEEVVAVSATRGLALDADGRLWILSTSSKQGQLQRLNTDGELETILADRPFEFPHQIVVDQDGVAYVTDGYAKTVWRVAGGEKPTSVVAGEPLKNPVGLAQQGDNLIVVDPHTKTVYSLSLDGQLKAIAGP